MNGGSDVYFSFDEFKSTDLRDVLLTAEELLERDLSGNLALFLLDEIQEFAGLEDQVKSLYDLHRNLKLMVSGSESLFIKHRSRAPLARQGFYP